MILADIKFERIISETSHYGVVWEGLCRKKSGSCIIKVVILDTGLHYDKEKRCYFDGRKDFSKKKAKKIFSVTEEEVPFLHHKYITRKAMSVDKFKHEIKMIKKVGKLGLAPNLYGWSIENRKNINYGIIIMEKLDCTLKNIIIDRVVKKEEINCVIDQINLLHDYGYKHGDLKPSNVGLKISERGKIQVIKFIDLAKTDYCREKELFERDIRTFYSHIKKNVSERNFLSEK